MTRGSEYFDSAIETVELASSDELVTWAKRVLTARTLDEVFAG